MKDALITLKQLDDRLLPLKEQAQYLIPKQGWVRTLRKALGMTIKQFAKRLGVDPSRIVKIETSEIEGAVTIRTLQSVAEAFDCTLVYGFIPKTSLEEMIKEQAKKMAAQQIKRVAHTMDLEAQSVEKNWLEDQTKDLTEELLQKSWEALVGGIDMFEYPAGATPLDLDEVAGLIPKHITTQNQLNEWEQVNILEAEKWISQKNFKSLKIATIEFVKKLHQKMFNKTWRWAGQFRQSNKNIGLDWTSISVNLQILIDDVQYQLKNKTYSLDELATRFHHRLVAIHPFANGNGRHARLMTDILLLSQGQQRFSWGSAQNLIKTSTIREKYIAALRTADKRDYSLLLEFVRQ